MHFNSHAHVERDTATLQLFKFYLLFQLTRSRGAWPTSSLISDMPLKFQLTRSRGAWRTYEETYRRIKGYFNSHAHVERDGIGKKAEHTRLIFQLTRSRGAWLASSTDLATPATISTHTLTWSVTVIFFIFVEYVQNFNSHAHVERDITTNTLMTYHNNFNSHAHVERDFFAFGLRVGGTNFNSHAHVERDIKLHIRNQHEYSISTHTLTWSVTRSRSA